MDNRIVSFRLDECVSAAWGKVHGAKATLWGAIGISFLVAFLVGILSGLLSGLSATLGVLVDLIGQAAGFLFQMGMIYIGIQRAKDLPINFKQVFYTFDINIALKVIGVYILEFLIFLIPSAIFFGLAILFAGASMLSTMHSGLTAASFLIIAWILLGVLVCVYLTLRMYFAIGFALDKGLNPIQAVKQSFAVTKGKEFKLLGLMIVQILSFIVGALLLGIGLIWAIPFVIILYGVAYNKISGNMPGKM